MNQQQRVEEMVEELFEKANKEQIRKALTTAYQRGVKEERVRCVKLVIKIFEKGLGFKKGSINDGLFQDLKEKILQTITPNE